MDHGVLMNFTPRNSIFQRRGPVASGLAGVDPAKTAPTCSWVTGGAVLRRHPGRRQGGRGRPHLLCS